MTSFKVWAPRALSPLIGGLLSFREVTVANKGVVVCWCCCRCAEELTRKWLRNDRWETGSVYERSTCKSLKFRFCTCFGVKFSNCATAWFEILGVAIYCMPIELLNVWFVLKTLLSNYFKLKKACFVEFTSSMPNPRLNKNKFIIAIDHKIRRPIEANISSMLYYVPLIFFFLLKMISDH